MRTAVEDRRHEFPQDSIAKMMRQEIDKLEDEIYHTQTELASKGVTPSNKKIESNTIKNNTSMPTSKNEQNYSTYGKIAYPADCDCIYVY